MSAQTKALASWGLTRVPSQAFPLSQGPVIGRMKLLIIHGHNCAWIGTSQINSDHVTAQIIYRYGTGMAMQQSRIPKYALGRCARAAGARLEDRSCRPSMMRIKWNRDTCWRLKPGLSQATQAPKVCAGAKFTKLTS